MEDFGSWQIGPKVSGTRFGKNGLRKNFFNNALKYYATNSTTVSTANQIINSTNYVLSPLNGRVYLLVYFLF